MDMTCAGGGCSGSTNSWDGMNSGVGVEEEETDGKLVALEVAASSD